MARIVWKKEGKYSAEIRENTGMIVEGNSVQIIQEERFTKGTVLLTRDEILAMAELIKNEGKGERETFRTENGFRVDYDFADGFEGNRLVAIGLLKKREEDLNSLLTRKFIRSDSHEGGDVKMNISNTGVIYGDIYVCYDEEENESYLYVCITNKQS